MQEGYDPFSSRVSINVSVNIIRTIVMALTGFLMVPYYIGSLGMATYAIIPLITSVTTYFLAMSDSLADAFTRYISQEQMDEKGLEIQMLSTGLLHHP